MKTRKRMAAKPMGRPPLPKAERKSVRLSFRVTPAFRREILAAAKREGKPLGTYIHETLKARVSGVSRGGALLREGGE